mgnify:CR=1 FL=1
MKNRVVISESELVNLINKVINEAESANCKCCDRGPKYPSEQGPGVNTDIAMINYAQHKLCCKKCKNEQAGMVSSGSIRREFNEGLSPCAPVSCQQGLYQAPSNHPTHPCKCVRKGQLLPKKKPNGNRRSLEMREYDNPFSLPGSGSGPNWLTQQANWANFDGTPATAPSPPQAFLNRMSQMSCNRKNMRYMALINKWSNTAGGHGGGFSSPTGTINPNNPRWQSILASKIIWLQNDLNQNCP